MANQLEIPFLNPLKFVPVNPATSARFYTRWADDYIFEDTIYNWQEKAHRYQPWRASDKITLQMSSNFQPLFLQLEDISGRVWIQQNMTQVRADKYKPGYFLYETVMDTIGLPENFYRALLTPGGSVEDQEKSEWLYIAPEIPRTVLIRYFNSEFHEDVIFETGIVFELRVPGLFDDREPGSLDTMYLDQGLNATQLSSKPFTGNTFYLGDGYGVAPWLVEKVNMVQTCSSVIYDGKLLAKDTGSKWTRYAEPGSAVKGYSIELRPGNNRSSRIINPNIDPTKKITLISNLDFSVFGGVENTGGTIISPIISFE